MKWLFILCFWLINVEVFAQANEKEDIMKVVKDVFIAMKANDSTLLKNCFTKNPSMYTVFKDKNDSTQLRTSSIRPFIQAVGKPKETVWSEPIWNEKVQIDGDLAAVWVDYAFYVDRDFSHCGVDAFHLARLNGQWKIFHLVDTRRKEACKVPPKVSKFFR